MIPRTRHLPSFFVPTLGHLNSLCVPTLGNLTIFFKKSLCMGVSLREGGGSWALLELTDALLCEQSFDCFHEKIEVVGQIRWR